MGRTTCRSAGSRVKNHAAPRTTTAPLIITVHCAPVSTGPATIQTGTDGMPLRHGPGQQAAEWRHAHERHGVVAHHAAALVFAHQRLDDGVARRHALHHAHAGHEHHQHREPEHTRQARSRSAPGRRPSRPAESCGSARARSCAPPATAPRSARPRPSRPSGIPAYAGRHAAPWPRRSASAPQTACPSG